MPTLIYPTWSHGSSDLLDAGSIPTLPGSVEKKWRSIVAAPRVDEPTRADDCRMSGLLADAVETPAHDSRAAGFEEDRLRGTFGTCLNFLSLKAVKALSCNKERRILWLMIEPVHRYVLVGEDQIGNVRGE